MLNIVKLYDAIRACVSNLKMSISVSNALDNTIVLKALEAYKLLICIALRYGIPR